MKCPKCNYTSFDYLDTCKKCGKDLTEHKEKFNLRSLLFASGAGTGAAAGEAAAAADDSFGFDFMEDSGGAETAMGADDGFVLDETNADFADNEEDDGFSFDNSDDFNFEEEK